MPLKPPGLAHLSFSFSQPTELASDLCEDAEHALDMLKQLQGREHQAMNALISSYKLTKCYISPLNQFEQS